MAHAKDVGDEAQVKPIEAKHKLDQNEELQQFQRLLEDYSFRRFIWNLLSQCKFYGSPPRDPIDQNREAGKRDIAVWMINEIFTANPEAYTMIRMEAKSREDGSTVSRDTTF